MRVADVIAPMGLEEFRDSYLDRRWVVVPGRTERYEPLVPWAHLNDALHRLRVPKNSARLRLVKDGKEIPANQFLKFSKWGGAVRTGAFERQLSEGATLVLNSVDELLPELRELGDDIEQALGGTVWANLYAGWRTQKGFDLHWDDHGTIVLQVYGRKAWTVYAPTCEAPTKDYTGSWIAPKDPPVWEGILEAGSVLYMPRGWWHVAVPLDEPTLHVTLGVRSLIGEDVLRWAVAKLHRERAFRVTLPPGGDPARDRKYLDELRQAVIAALSEDCLDGVRQRARAEMPRFPAPNLPGAIVPEPSIRPDSWLLLASAAGLETVRLPTGRISVTVNGSEWTCSPELADVLSQMSAVRPLRFDDLRNQLPLAMTMELKLLLTAMQRQGELVVRSSVPEQVAADQLSLA